MARTTNFRNRNKKDVEQYIAKLMEGSPESKKEAKDALIRTGVLKKNGKPKEVIVSWE
ncbi:MAG: hypothetical protein IJI23_02110 [Lachnospiraceae bacterium]|nr:hypothetical protein [Lachnospiraceae bacterium]MBQ8946639.1 hypothetical protein [Lachnospiraceae bacterium]